MVISRGRVIEQPRKNIILTLHDIISVKHIGFGIEVLTEWGLGLTCCEAGGVIGVYWCSYFIESIWIRTLGLTGLSFDFSSGSIGFAIKFGFIRLDAIDEIAGSCKRIAITGFGGVD